MLRLYVDFAMFLSRWDLKLESREDVVHLLTGFCSRRVFGFSVWAFLVDVLDFVIVLCHSGVFEYILFCARAVVATRICFWLVF